MDLAKIEIENAAPEHVEAGNNALPTVLLDVARAGS